MLCSFLRAADIPPIFCALTSIDALPPVLKTPGKHQKLSLCNNQRRVIWCWQSVTSRSETNGKCAILISDNEYVTIFFHVMLLPELMCYRESNHYSQEHYRGHKTKNAN